MIVAGLDPGTRRCGFAVIRVVSTKMEIIEMGTWRLPEKESLGRRLEVLHQESTEFIRKYNPKIIGLAEAVAFKNVASALTLSEARGILRLSVFENLENAQDRLVELSPTQVKRSGVGSGNANKASLEKFMQWRFGKPAELMGAAASNSDAFDAMAIAWAAWIVHNGVLKRTLDERQTRP